MTLDRPGAARRVSAAVLALALAAPAVVPLADEFAAPGAVFAQEEDTTDDTSDDASCEVVATDDDDEDGLYCAGEVIVRLQPGSRLSDLPSRFRTSQIAGIPSRNVFLLEVEIDEENEAIADLESDDNVAWAELNFVGNAPQGNPSRFFPRRSGIGDPTPATGIDSEARELIGADALPCVNGRGVKVAVIDTGLQVGHPLFKNRKNKKRNNRVVQPWNAFNGKSSRRALADVGDGDDNDRPADIVPGNEPGQGQNSPELIDEAVGHGTHVAGIVLQAAPRASVMPIKALDSDGAGQAFYLARAIARATDKNADVINLSLGAPSMSQAVEDAVTQAVGEGIVVVAAAGNAGGIDETSGAVVEAPPEYPAAMGDVIAVGATDENDDPAVFSSRYDEVDLSAPGVDIASAFPRGAQGVNSRYARWSGTSMATPWVAGAAALMLDLDPQLTPADVAQTLNDGAEPFDGDVTGMGVGRLDVGAAIDCPEGGGKKGTGKRKR